MKTRLTLFAAGIGSLLLAACALHVTPKPPTVPRPMAIHTHVPQARVWLTWGTDAVRVEVLTDANGDTPVFSIPSDVTVFNVYAEKPGGATYGGFVARIPAGVGPVDGFFGECPGGCQNGSNAIFVGPGWSQHADPMAWSMDRLLAIRGAMWTARLNLPYGPRPGSDDNILAFDYYQFYSAADRKRMLDAYGPNSARGYTHAVTGPVIGTDCYHSLWPCHDADQPGMMPWDGVPTQAQWDFYLDCMQEMWDAGIAPVHFAHPDGWSFEDMAKLEALYMQPRAQRLLRIIVWTGWEPAKYEWSNATWVQFFRRAHEIFPSTTALGLHTVCDIDAPTGGHDDTELPAGQGNVISWQRAVPYLNFWLVQNCGYFDGGTPVPSPTFLQNFRDQFDPTKGRASLVARFRSGVAGWPTYSRNGGPLKVINAEVSSYANTWKNWPESEAIKLGAAAMEAGADGFLDGGPAR